METKHEMREAVIERLRNAVKHPPLGVLCADDITEALVGDGWVESSVDEDAEYIINLLTDDDEPQYEGDTFAKGPRDADGILWFRGDMSDSEWGVIERPKFDGERWMVCGHDISAPWIPADSIRHAPMRTATQREDDLIGLIKDAARDYESLQADCRGMSDLKDTCWQKFKDLHEAVDERYIELPMDANGEVIHVGDEMVVGDYRFIVDGVGLADRTDILFETDGDKSDCFPAKVCRHYRLPTIEDVLREFADKVTDSQVPGTHPTYEEAIAEYAEKLQLKEGEDE